MSVNKLRRAVAPSASGSNQTSCAEQVLADALQVMPAHWSRIIEALDVAFQPIVDIRTGACVAFESFVRNTDSAGFSSLEVFFDAAHRLGVLPQTDVALQEMALRKFTRFAKRGSMKLFVNVDARTIETVQDALQRMGRRADSHGLSISSVVVEISERRVIDPSAPILATLGAVRADVCGLAIEDFATGFLGLPLLYYSRPNYVKVGRTFLTDMVVNSERKAFVHQIVHVAHMAGAKVVAVGVETEEEFRVCREIGCDLMQGRILQEATVRIEDLLDHYPAVEVLCGTQGPRARRGGRRALDDQIEFIPPILETDSMDEVFERFRREGNRTFFPVTRSTGELVGLVVEARLKGYAYSMFGKELISNKMIGHGLMEFLIPCPTADINETPQEILDIFSRYDSTLGIVILENGMYAGFLHAHMLLRLIQDINVAKARDENPLSRLPGNNAINEYIARALTDVGTEYNMVYFDFDNFKPFNDKYGFRQGDRAIILFSEIMIKESDAGASFCGHVGGDDFFVAFKGMSELAALETVRRIRRKFTRDVESFYDEEARRCGFIVALDRHGIERRMPLLTVSAGVVSLPKGRAILTPDHLSSRMSDLKKAAKEDVEGVSCVVLAC